MTIRLRGKSYQIDVQLQGVRVRETVQGTYADAQLRETEVRLCILKGTYQKPLPSPTVSNPKNSVFEVFWSCFDRYYSQSRSADTARSNINVLVSFFGANTCISAMDAQAVDRFIAHLRASGARPSTINRRLAVLSKCLKFAQQRGILSNHVEVSYEKINHTKDRTFTDEERVSIETYHYLQGDGKWSDFFILLLATGCRCGELRDALVSDLRENVLSLHQTKTNKARSVALTSKALEAFHRSAPFSFATPTSIERKWNEIREYLNLSADREFTPHACRHDFATRFLRRGGSLAVLSKWLGHSSIVQTLRYAHVESKDITGVVELLEDEEDAA